MKNRLDVQSLLEGCGKEDLVRFLRSRFAQNKSLADDFIIHFAASFELEEENFHLITDRIRRMFPKNLSNLTHSKARPIKYHIQDLMEQTRDSHSKQNYRQAYIIISHVIALLDKYTDQISDKYGFTNLQNKSYQLLDGIYRDSPAPSLKLVMSNFLKSMIQDGKAIPFPDTVNPYNLLLKWQNDLSHKTTSSLLNSLDKKITEYPAYRNLFWSRKIQLLIEIDDKKKLTSIIKSHGDERIIYETMFQHLPENWLNDPLQEALREQYICQNNRPLKNSIFQILQNHGNGMTWINELAVQEYFDSGDIGILEGLLQNSNCDKPTLASLIGSWAESLNSNRHFRLYSAYRFLERPDLLMEQLLEADDIFDILPFLGDVYPVYKDEIKELLNNLMINYLKSHFGPPAIQYVNSVLDELNRLSHYDMQDFLIRSIRHNFGHRKHFQKLMKEMVQ